MKNNLHVSMMLKPSPKLNWKNLASNAHFLFPPKSLKIFYKLNNPTKNKKQNIFLFYLSEKLSPLISSLSARIRDNIRYFLGNNWSFQGDPTTHPSI